MAGHRASFERESCLPKEMPTETSVAKFLGNFLGVSLAVLSLSDLPVVADGLASLLLCHVWPCRHANLASQELRLLAIFAVLVNSALPQLLLSRQVRPSGAKPHV